MNREDIIRMAREAGMTSALVLDDLERFAALVADAQYAEHQQTLALQQRSYEREIQIEVETEREECAKTCEEYDDDRGTGETWGPRFAEMIRARSNT